MSDPAIMERAKKGRRLKEETSKRRSIVKKMFFDEGITSATVITRLLKERHNMVVDRSAIDRDIQGMGTLDGTDYESFSKDALNVLRQNIKDLQKLILEETSTSKKAILMKTLSSLCVDEQRIAAGLMLTGRKTETNLKEKRKVVFGEPDVDEGSEEEGEDAVDESG